MKTTDFITENKFIADDAHAMHQDHEVQMARADCYNAAKYAIELHKLLKNISEMQGLDGWVSEKITLANDYLRTVAEYLRHEQLEKQAQMPEMFTAESAEAKFNALLNEFAPSMGGGDDGGDDGFDEETLKRLAAQWFNGDEDPRVEQVLMAAGWEIGQDEGYDDEPGVFVVMSGDENGKSYMSWPADELRSGVSEGSDNLAIGQQMARDGIEYDPAQEGEIISQIGDYLKRSGMTPRQIRGYMIDNDFVSDQLSYLPRKYNKPNVSETTSAGGIATVPGVGGGPKVGSLFGGSYNPKTPFTAKKKSKSSVIKR
jgi:hypothetical protein